jgi:hypothetical protein
MHYEIKILCPSQKCGKCRRMISRVEEAVNLTGVDARIIIVDKLEEMLHYPTWILPTLIINENIVAKGYVPDIKRIQEFLNQT